MTPRYTSDDQLNQIIAKFAQNNTNEKTLENHIVKMTSKLYNQVSQEETFAAKFKKLPYKEVEVMLQIIGLTEQQLRVIMARYGFIKHKIYLDSYHQTCMMAYMIGLHSDNENIRKGALFISLAKMTNGTQGTPFPQGIQEDIARYVQHYMLPKNSLVTKMHLGDITMRFMSDTDAKNSPIIKKTLKNKPGSAGSWLYLQAQMRKKPEQMYKMLMVPYYIAYKKNNRAGSVENLQTSKNEEGGNREHFSSFQTMHSTLEIMVNKFMNAKAFKRIEIDPSQIQLLQQDSKIAKAVFAEFEDFIDGEEHDATNGEILSLYLYSIGVSKEADLERINIIMSTQSVMSSSSQEITSMKKAIDAQLRGIDSRLVPEKRTMTTMSRARKSYLRLLVLKFMKIMVKRQKFEHFKY